MTAHIDEESQELELLEYDPHDCHSIAKWGRKKDHERKGWKFAFCVCAVFLLLSLISRSLS